MNAAGAKSAWTDTFRSVHHRNFRLFLSGQLVSQIGTWLTQVAQVLLVLDLTDQSGVAVGLLVAFQYAPVLLIGAWAGVVADRSDKRRLLLIVQTCAMAQSFVLASLAFMDNPPLAAIYVTAMFGGIATAFDNPARRAFVVEMVPLADMPNAVSLNSAVMTGSRVVGPAIAGLLVVTVGYGWCFLLDGFSYLAVLAGLWLINSGELRRPPATPAGKGQVREGLRYARSIGDLRIPLVMMGIVGALAFNFQVVLPLFVTESVGGSKGTFTLIYAVLSVGSMIGALATARRATVTVRDVVVASTLFGVSIALLALSPHLIVAFVLAFGVGYASIVFMTSATAIVQMRADPSMRGRVLALQSMVFLGSTPIGGPIMGFICDAVNPRAAFLVGAAACLGAAAWGIAADRHRAVADGGRGRGTGDERLVSAAGIGS